MTTTAGPITAACPRRSTNRDSSGAHTAWVSTTTAATRPASAYEPYRAEIPSTTLMPTVEMGRRASTPAAEKARAPGRASTSRYGASTP